MRHVLIPVLLGLAGTTPGAVSAAQERSENGDDIVVTGSTTAATKTDTPLLSIPQSVSIIDRRRLDDRLSRTLNEALAYTPGVNVGSYGFDPRFDAFFLRGFQATYTGLFRDGLRQLSSPSGLWRNEPYGIDRLTVVRGPASVLYGASGAGGLVDVTSKRPLDRPYAEVQGLVGSYDRYQLNGDVSLPLSDAVAIRLSGVARNANTSLDGFKDDRYFLAPALRVYIDAATRVTLLGEYMWSEAGASAAYYNDANGVTDVLLSDPRFNRLTHEQWRAGYDAEHRFSENLSVHQNLRFQRVAVRSAYSYPIAVTPVVSRLGAVVTERTPGFSIDNQIRWNVRTGPLRHRLLVGIDYNHVSYRTAEGYGTVPVTSNGYARPATAETVAQTFGQTGVYAQDQIEAGRLGITAGIRHDWLDASTRMPGVPGFDRHDTKVTGRIGATYRIDGGVAPYVNWSTSFEPNIGVLLDGTPARPTNARQVEAGIKWQPRNRVTLTAAVFQIEQHDGVVFDASTGVNRQVQLDLRSRGVELEASARPIPELDLTAAYALTDVDIRRGAIGTIGNTLSATPRHTASAWADYADARSGIGGGGGVRYFGPSWGNDLNTIRNGDRLFVDAVVHYDLKAPAGLRLQLNATNLFDRRPQTCAAGYCYRDQGRTLLGAVRYRF